MRILIADDDRASRRLLQGALTSYGYDVVVARDGAEAWSALQAEDGPKLAILDWMMPVLDGVEVCRRLRDRPSASYVYCLLLTSRDRKADVVAGLEAGADDCVAKPLDAEELEARLRSGCRILGLEEALRMHATYDALTGALNRGAILDLLQRELARANREGSPLAVIMSDLDRFKAVNDTHGHQAGDAVLREAARRMRASVRAYDGIGRYGGEEFLIVLPGCDGRSGLALAERIRRQVAAEPIPMPEGSRRVTVSLGIAALRGDRPARADDLIRAADAALYRAKRAGRDRAELGALPKSGGALRGSDSAPLGETEPTQVRMGEGG